MSPCIVQSSVPITLLGAGAIHPSEATEALALAPCLVAADGGANVAIAAGLVPAAVIGDLDSILPATRAAIPEDRLWHIAEQTTTDFEKCLSRIEAPLILGLGFAGPRIDHGLAVWNVLVRYPQKVCLILGAEDVAFAAPRQLALDLAAGTRVSLFPLARMRGQSRGLRWAIDAVRFAPMGAMGVSNSAEGPVQMAFDGPGMLVVLPRACLAQVIAAVAPGVRPASFDVRGGSHKAPR